MGQSAVGLHEAELAVGAKTVGDAVNIAAQDRREVGVDNSRTGAGHEPDQRGDLVAGRNLPKAGLAREGDQSALMRRVGPSVHQRDSNGVETVGAKRGQQGCCGRFIQRAKECSVGTNPLVNFDRAVVQHRRQNNMARKNIGPRLVADPKRIGEATRGQQDGPYALAFEQRVGCNRGAHSHLADGAALGSDDPADSLERRIVIVAGIDRQQLGYALPLVRAVGNNIRKGATAIDGEGPSSAHYRVQAECSRALKAQITTPNFMKVALKRFECGSALKREPARAPLTELIFLYNPAQGWGPDRRRWGPRHGASFRR